MAELVSRLNEAAQEATVRALMSLNLKEVLATYLRECSDSNMDLFALLNTVSHKDAFQLAVYSIVGEQELVSSMLSGALKASGDVSVSEKLLLGCNVICLLANRDEKNAEVVSDKTPSVMIDVLEWSLDNPNHVDDVGDAAMQAIIDMMSCNEGSIEAFSTDSSCRILSRYLSYFDNAEIQVINDSVGYRNCMEVIWVLCTDSAENRVSFSRTAVHVSLAEYWRKLMLQKADPLISPVPSLRVERAVLSAIRYLCTDCPENKTKCADLNIADGVLLYINIIFIDNKIEKVVSYSDSHDVVMDDLEELIVEDTNLPPSNPTGDNMTSGIVGSGATIPSRHDIDDVLLITQSEVLNQALYVLAVVTLAHDTRLLPTKQDIFVIFNVLRKCKKAYLVDSTAKCDSGDWETTVDFADVPGIMSTCFDILSDICSCADNIERMYSSDISIISFLFDILCMKQCQESSLMISSLFSALNSICSIHNVSCIKEVIDLEVIPLILEIYSKFLKKDFQSIHLIMKLLCSIMTCDSVNAKIPILACKESLADFVAEYCAHENRDAAEIESFLEMVHLLIKISATFLSKFSDKTYLTDALLSILSTYISKSSLRAGESFSICLKCCNLIRALCLHDGKNVVRFIVGEIFDIIVDAVESTGDLESTAVSFASVTNTLTNLIDNESNKMKYRDLLGKAGTCNAIVEGLPLFINSASIITKEMAGAIVGLCRNHSENLLDIVDCGIVKSVSEVLQHFLGLDQSKLRENQENVKVFCDFLRCVFDNLLTLNRVSQRQSNGIVINPFSPDADVDVEDPEEFSDNGVESKLCFALLGHIEHSLLHIDKDLSGLDCVVSRFLCFESLLRFSDSMRNLSVLMVLGSAELAFDCIRKALEISDSIMTVNGVAARRKKLHCTAAWAVAYLCRNSASMLIKNGEPTIDLSASMAVQYQSNLQQLYKSNVELARLLLLYSSDNEFFGTDAESIDHVKAVCTAVWGLAHDLDETRVARLGEIGGCALVQKCFVDFVSNSYLTIVASSTLQQMIRCRSNVTVLKELDLASSIAHVLRQHATSIHVTQPLCAVVSHLARDSDLRNQLGQWGVCELVVRIAKSSQGKSLSKTNILSLFGALLHLARDSESNIFLICEFGGIDLIISAVDQYNSASSAIEVKSEVKSTQTENVSCNVRDDVILILSELLELLLHHSDGNVKDVNKNNSAGCECMIQVLKNHAANFNVVSKVAHILRRFIEIDSANKTVLHNNNVMVFLFDYYMTFATTDAKTHNGFNVRKESLLPVYFLIGCLYNHNSPPFPTLNMKSILGRSSVVSSNDGITVTTKRLDKLPPKEVSYLLKEFVAVATLIKQYEHNVQYCTYLVSFMLNILERSSCSSEDMSFLEILIEMDICDILVQLLMKNVSNESFATSVVCLFNFLCQDNTVSSVVIIGNMNNLYSTLLSCVMCHSHDCGADSRSVVIINNCLSLLRTLSVVFDNQVRMVDATYVNNKQSVSLSSAITSIICDALEHENYTTVAHACGLIISLCETKEDIESTSTIEEMVKFVGVTQNLFSEAGVCRPLVNAVRNFSSNAKHDAHLPAVIYACGILCGNEESVHEKILKDFTDLSLDRQLILHFEGEDISRQMRYALCFALNSLSNEHLVVKRLGDIGFCFTVSEIFRKNISHDDLPCVVSTLQVIQKLSSIKENCEKLGDSKVLDDLVTVLQKYGDKKTVADTSTKNTKNVVTVLCTRLIYELSDGASSDILEAVGKHGAGEHIMYILKYFLTLDVDVVLNCCRCVWSLTNSHPANKSRFCDIGVCSPLMQCLKKYKNNDKVIFAAAGAARSVSGQPEAARQLVASGLCELSVELLDSCIDHIDIVDQILGLFVHVVANDAEARHLLVDNGFCEKLLQCIDHVVTDTPRNDEVSFMLSRQKSSNRFVHKYSDSADIVTLFCNIVSSLSQTPANALFLTKLGVYRVIVRAIKQFPKVENVALSAAMATKLLSRMNPIFAILFIDDGSYSHFITMLELHGRNEDIVEAAYFTLYNVMMEICNADKVLDCSDDKLITPPDSEVVDVSQLDTPEIMSGDVEGGVLTLAESKLRLTKIYSTNDGLLLITDRKAFSELFVLTWRMHSKSLGVTEVCCRILSLLIVEKKKQGLKDEDAQYAVGKTVFRLHDQVGAVKGDDGLITVDQETSFLSLLVHYEVVEAVSACLTIHITDFKIASYLFKIITLLCVTESKVQLLFGHQDISLAINLLFDQYREQPGSLEGRKKNTEGGLNKKDNPPPPIPKYFHRDLCIAVSAVTLNNAENALAMGASGLCEIMASVLEEFINHADMCSTICDTICHLCYKCESNINKFDSLDVPTFICRVLKEHVRVPSSVFVSCQAIVLFSEIPRIRVALSKIDYVCDILVKAFVTHVTSDINVMIAVSWAIAVFTKFKQTALVFDNNKTCLVLLECLMENKSIKELVVPVVVSIMELSVLPSAVEIFAGSLQAYSSLIDILHTYADEPKVVEAICVSLINLVKTEQQRAKLVAPRVSSPDNGQVISSPEAICLCLQLQIDNNQSRNGQFILLVTLLVQLVLCICHGSVRNAEQFGDAGICEVLMKLVGNPVVGDNAELLAKIFKAMEVMGVSQKNKLMLGKDDHSRVLLKVLKNNIYNKTICITSCSALSSICIGVSLNKDIFGENGACSLVCELIRVHTDDASVIGAACAALWSIGSGNSKNTERLSQIVSISDLLIEVLKLHFDNGLVCGAVSGLLSAILQIDQSHFPAMKSCKMQEICLAMLTTYGNNASVVAPALTLLRLLFKNEMELNAELNPFSKHSKECACLVKLIQQFKTNVVILEEACQSIAVLCSDPSSPCIQIFGEKLNIYRLLPEIISVAIIDKNRLLASLALKVIALLCTGNSVNQQKFGETDACQVIIFVVQKLNPTISTTTAKKGGSSEGEKELISGMDNSAKVTEAVIELEKSALMAICMIARHSSTKSSENTSNIDKLMLEGACEFIMSIVENRLDNAEVVYLAFRAIFSLSGNEACSHRFNRNGICDIITEVLNKFRKNNQLAHYVCGVVANIAVIDDGNALLVVEKVPEAIVDTLRESGMVSKDVATFAFVALDNLVGNRPKLRTQLGECGACKAVIQAVKVFQNDSLVLKTAISLIANLVLDNANNADRFIAEDAFQVVVDSAFQHVEDSTLCHSSFVFILSTSSFSKDSIVALLDANVCILVSKTLKAHPGNGSIVDICCVATQYMLSGNKEINERVGKEIIDQNIPENLLFALKNHSSDLLTVQSGLKLLLAMMKTATSVVDKMVACGVVKYIIDSLSFNPLPNTVASPVCDMISLIAHNDFNRIQLKRQDLCLRLTNILELFIIDEKMISQVCLAMTNLMTDCPENIDELIKSNVSIHLIKALNKHQLVKERGTDILKVITHLVNNNPQAQKLFIGEVLCLAVSAYYLRFYTDLECATLSCNLIKYIARSSSDRVILGKSGVCGVISSNIETFIDSQTGSLEFVAALHAMSVENKDNTEIFGLKGACEGLVHSLTVYSTDIDFVCLGLRAIVVLSSNRINAHKLTNCNACLIVTDSFKYFLTDPKVPRLALTAVRAMSCACEESRVAFNSSGIFAPILDCVRKNIGHAPVVESACAVLMTLLDRSKSTVTAASTVNALPDASGNRKASPDKLVGKEVFDFRESGGVGVINDVLNGHIASSAIVSRVCNIIICICSQSDTHSDVQVEIGKVGVCANVVLALSHHMQEKVVNAIVCTTIRSLCKDSSNRYTLGSVGGCVVIAKLLQFAIQFEDLKLVVEVLSTVRALTEDSCSNQSIFGKLGTCDYISGLVGSENGIEIDLNTMSCISYLCRSGKDESTCSESNCIAFGSGQAFEGIISALQEHRSADEVAIAGLVAFDSLCSVGSNIELFVNLGGCQIVADIMKANLHNVAVCKAGLVLLTTLVSVSKFARNLSQINALELTSLAFRRHESSTDVLIKGCILIVALHDASPYDVIKHQFMDSSLCPCIINNWRKQLDSVEIFENVVNVIERMCSLDKEMKVDFGASGALESIIRTMKLQLNSPNTVHICTRAANRAIKALTDNCNENIERFRLVISGTELESVLTIEGALSSATLTKQDEVLWESAVDME